MSAVALFAHQGGWDEALLVLGPLVLLGSLLHLANRRLKSRLKDLEPSAVADSTGSDPLPHDPERDP